MTRIGKNVLAQFLQDTVRQTETVQQLQPDAMLVMDNPLLAQTYKRLLPDAVVVHRAYSPNDKDWHTRKSDGSWTFPPEQWLQNHRSTAGHGVVLQVFNEPAPGNLDDFFSWLEALVRLCPADITLAICAFAVGNPWEKDIENGVYDRIIHLLWGTRHFLMLHEYFKEDVEGEYPWLCGRFIFWLERCVALRLARTEVEAARSLHIFIGEAGRDIGGGRNDGWRGTGWSEETYAAKCIQQAKLYAPYGIRMCVFCDGRGADNMWESFDTETAGTYNRKLSEFNRSIPPMTQTIPAPTTGGQRVRITGLPAGTNRREIRSQPRSSATDVGDLLLGDVVVLYPTFPQNGRWLYLKRESDGQDGWSEFSGVTYEVVTQDTPTGITISVADLNRLLELDSIVEDTTRERIQIMSRLLPG